MALYIKPTCGRYWVPFLYLLLSHIYFLQNRSTNWLKIETPCGN